jgi:signal transduction histidine kinase
MIDNTDNLFNDFEAIRQIPIVPAMLEVICQTTGMGFAAIARVTNERWLACSVRDEVGFGLREGGELNIKTTLCSEIRDHQKPIIIDHFEEDSCYKNHHTPKTYGLQSYISFPIILKDGTFFGTLCAIDSKPAGLNNTKIIGMFTMFADLLSFHLQSLDVLERSYITTKELQEKNTILTAVNTDLDSIVHTASHDLKSPIANMEGLLNILYATVAEDKISKDKINQLIGLLKTSFKRFEVTLKDLTSIVETEYDSLAEQSEKVNIVELIENLKEDLNPLIEESNAKIEVIGLEVFSINFPKKNFRSIIYNLLSNAIKYRSPDRSPEIVVDVGSVNGKIILSVTDNGLGIPSDKLEKVFTIYNRFHDHVEGSGLGLYIVKRIVDTAKGQIGVKSSLDKGTTFTISF